MYVKAPGKEAVRPVLELKGFTKVFLEPGEEKQVEIEISDLDYWNGDLGSWELEGGDYEILVGTSSENLPFRLPLRVTGTVRRKSYDHNTMLGELLEHKTAGSWARHTREEFTKAMTGGSKIRTRSFCWKEALWNCRCLSCAIRVFFPRKG